MPQRSLPTNHMIYFLSRELFTPACSHLLIVGLRKDIGKAVKTPNDNTSIKSVVKWFIPKSVPASQSQGNAVTKKEVGIESFQLSKEYQGIVCNDSSLCKNYQFHFALRLFYLLSEKRSSLNLINCFFRSKEKYIRCK